MAAFYTAFLPTILAPNGAPNQVPRTVTRAAEAGAARRPHERALHATLLPATRRPAAAGAGALTFVDWRALGVMGRAFNDTAAFYNRLPGAP